MPHPLEQIVRLMADHQFNFKTVRHRFMGIGWRPIGLRNSVRILIQSLVRNRFRPEESDIHIWIRIGIWHPEEFGDHLEAGALSLQYIELAKGLGCQRGSVKNF